MTADSFRICIFNGSNIRRESSDLRILCRLWSSSIRGLMAFWMIFLHSALLSAAFIVSSSPSPVRVQPVHSRPWLLNVCHLVDLYHAQRYCKQECGLDAGLDVENCAFHLKVRVTWSCCRTLLVVPLVLKSTGSCPNSTMSICCGFVTQQVIQQLSGTTPRRVKMLWTCCRLSICCVSCCAACSTACCTTNSQPIGTLTDLPDFIFRVSY